MATSETMRYVNTAIYIAAFFAFTFVQYSNFKGRRPGKRLWLVDLFYFMMCVWIFGSAVEEFFRFGAFGMAFTKLKHCAAITLPTVWLLIALTYSRIEAGLSKQYKRMIALILVIPVGGIAAIMTDGAHHLFYGTLRNGYGNGPLFYVMASSTILFLAAGLLIMSAKLFETRAPGRENLIVLLSMYVAVPVIGRGMEITNLIKMGTIISPLTTAIGAVAAVIGVKRFSLLRWMPLSISEVIESMPAGVIVIDRSGELMTLNPAATRMLGIENHAELLELIEEVSDKLSERRPGINNSFDLVFGEKTLRFQRLEIQRAEEVVDGMIISVTDVSGEHELIDAQKDFVTSMSSEMQPHFDSVLKSLERIENTAKISNPDNLAAFGELRRARLRLGQLAGQLELFGKLESGEYSPMPESIDIISVINAAVQHLKDIHAADGCSIETDLPLSIFYNIDPVLFSAMVESLVSGLAKYSESRHITLKAYANEDGVVLDAFCFSEDCLADRKGAAFSESFADISAKLAISDTRTLGIAICRAVAALLNGRFNVNMDVDNKIQFTVVLPQSPV
ncbi:MAG: histidine kinase N-terminal 7TM domain-containing protein [bacterium]